jgi:hypothetical protein
MTDSDEHRHQYYLAAIPFVAYFCMFAYDAGRFAHFGISPEYLELSSQRIAQLAFITLLALLLLAALLTYLISLAESSSENWSFFGSILLWTIPAVAFAALLAPGCWNFLMAISVGLIKATDPFFPRKTRAIRTKGQERMNNLRNDLLWIILLLGFTSVLFYRSGEIVQQFDETALVMKSNSSAIVVGAYSGSLLIKDFDPRTGRLISGFRLVPSDGATIVEVKVGKLRR